jgi:Membrane dipeptidase (Peptidase family M19)
LSGFLREVPLIDGHNDQCRMRGRHRAHSQEQERHREMHGVVMLVDLSHVSAKTMNDVLDVTLAAVIFSLHRRERSSIICGMFPLMCYDNVGVVMG